MQNPYLSIKKEKAEVITYIFDAPDWTQGVKSATNKEELLEWVEACMPFVEDALESVEMLDWNEWMLERDNCYKTNGIVSKKWMEKYGAIVLPENFLIGAEIADTFKAPLGCALIRLAKVRPDLLKIKNKNAWRDFTKRASGARTS